MAIGGTSCGSGGDHHTPNPGTCTLDACFLSQTTKRPQSLRMLHLQHWAMQLAHRGVPGSMRPAARVGSSWACSLFDEQLARTGVACGFLRAPHAMDRRSLGWLPGVIGTALVDSRGTSQMVVGPLAERPCHGASSEGWSGSGVRSARGSQAGR